MYGFILNPGILLVIKGGYKMGVRVFQAETNSNCLKAQGSMMSAVACASVPKITVVIGGCHGADSYAMVSSVMMSLTYLYIYV